MCAVVVSAQASRRPARGNHVRSPQFLAVRGASGAHTPVFPEGSGRTCSARALQSAKQSWNVKGWKCAWKFRRDGEVGWVVLVG